MSIIFLISIFSFCSSLPTQPNLISVDLDQSPIIETTFDSRNQTIQISRNRLNDSEKILTIINSNISFNFQLIKKGDNISLVAPQSIPGNIQSMLGSLALFDRLPQTFLIYGTNFLQLPLFIANKFQNSIVDVLEEDNNLLSKYDKHFGLNNTKIGNLRILRTEKEKLLIRNNFYEIVFLNIPCDQISKENLTYVSGLLTNNGVVSIYLINDTCFETLKNKSFELKVVEQPKPTTSTTTTSTTSTTATSTTTTTTIDANNSEYYFKVAYLFLDPNRPEFQQIETFDQKSLVFDRSFGPYKYYTLFNRAKSISKLQNLGFDLGSDKILPLEIESYVNKNEEEYLLHQTYTCQDKKIEKKEEEKKV